MTDPVTTISLIVLTLLSLAACGFGIDELRRPTQITSRNVRRLILWIVTVAAAAIFIYRELVIHEHAMVLEAHVDGLLLIAALLGGTLLFLESRTRMRGLGIFAMPLLTLLLAWAICASSFTWHGFAIGSVWMAVHLAGVYLGLLFCGMAAISGGMYLYVQQRLRHKMTLPPERRLPSLEALERLIVRMSAFGFALLTLGLVTGMVVATAGPTALGPGWWMAPKVVLAAVVWLLYALVMNVRHAATFRGTRAAWLSIAGLVLVLLTFAIATTLPPLPSNAAEDSHDAPAPVLQEAP